MDSFWHGSLNVPIEHHPTIRYNRYMVYHGYFFRWCPIFPKWDSYQPLFWGHCTMPFLEIADLEVLLGLAPPTSVVLGAIFLRSGGQTFVLSTCCDRPLRPCRCHRFGTSLVCIIVYSNPKKIEMWETWKNMIYNMLNMYLFIFFLGLLYIQKKYVHCMHIDLYLMKYGEALDLGINQRRLLGRGHSSRARFIFILHQGWTETVTMLWPWNYALIRSSY